jgi:hypothetical protein
LGDHFVGGCCASGVFAQVAADHGGALLGQ